MEYESVAAEEQEEGHEASVVVTRQHRLQVGLVVGAGAGPGPMIVQAPDAAVGQDSPPDAPVGDRLRRGQVPQNLAVGCAVLDLVGQVSAVEREAGPLALLNQQGILVAVLRVGAPGGLHLGIGVGEKQVVGDVLVPLRPLLRQVVGPAEKVQRRPHQVLLSQGLVGRCKLSELVNPGRKSFLKGGKCLRLAQAIPPLGCSPDPVGKKIFSKQLAGHDKSNREG